MRFTIYYIMYEQFENYMICFQVVLHNHIITLYHYYNMPYIRVTSQKTHSSEPNLIDFWASIENDDSTLKSHCSNCSSLVRGAHTECNNYVGAYIHLSGRIRNSLDICFS